MYSSNDFNDAVSFLKAAEEKLKNVNFKEPEATSCSCCCTSHGGGKAKYEEKDSVNSLNQSKE